MELEGELGGSGVLVCLLGRCKRLLDAVKFLMSKFELRRNAIIPCCGVGMVLLWELPPDDD